MPERSGNSECPPSAAQLSVNTSTSVVLQDSVIVPYPKAGTWFTTLSMSCFISDTNTRFVIHRLESQMSLNHSAISILFES